MTLTGHITDREIRSRQIFVVEEISEDGEVMKIRSPFQSFEIEGHERIEGTVKISLAKAMSIFEFVTVGYFMPNY